MSVRSCPIGDTLVNGAGAAQTGVTVRATLLVPGAALALDSSGDIIDLTPLKAITDNTGTYLFDPAASPTNGLIAPGDIYQLVSGSLVALPGCVWQITYLSTTIISPSFAYSASEIHPSSWIPSLPTLDLLKMDLTDVLGSGAAIQGAGFTIAIGQPAVWTGGAGAGQRVDGSFALSTNSAGQIFTYLVRSSELNPSGTPYTLSATPPGGQPGIWTFICPTTYSGTYGGATYTDRGVYNGGTTYALNDVVRRAADDVPFVSLTNSNTGNALTDGTHWAVHAGAAITAYLQPSGPPLQLSYTAAVIAHTAEVEVLADDSVQSPLTLADDLTILDDRTSFALRTITSSGAIDHGTDDYLLIDATGAAVTATLPDATTRVRPYTLIRVDSALAHAATLATTGGQTIDGQSSLLLQSQWQSVTLKPAGSAWRVASRHGLATVRVTGNYTAGVWDDVILADCTSGGLTVTLPTAVGFPKTLFVLKADATANTLTVAAAGGQTVNGASSVASTSAYGSFLLAADSANSRWFTGTGGAGASAFSWTTKTANYSIGANDTGILADATSGAITVTLPTAVGSTAAYAVKKKDASVFAVTVATTSSQTIDGQTTRVLAFQDAAIYVASDGANWYEVAPPAQLGAGSAGQTAGMVGGDPAWLWPSGLVGVAAGLDLTQAEGDLLYRKKATTTTLQVGFIGDSITANVPTGGSAPPTNAASALATTLAIAVNVINQGVGGTSTSDWLSGSTNLVSAKAAFGGPAATPIVSIALGVNDADSALHRSSSSFQANLQNIVNDLVGSGYLVVLQCPTFTVPGSLSAFDATSNTLQVAYQQAIRNVCNGRTVFCGDTSGYLWFQAHPAQLSDGVHPTAAGSTNLGTLWAAGLQPLATALAQIVTLARLPIGASGQSLQVSSGYPAWQNNPAGFANPMTALGDLITGATSGTPQRLAAGSTGQVLTISGGAPGWATPASGFADPTTTKGDLIVHGASTTRLGVGTNGQVLTANSAATNGVDWENAGAWAPLVNGDTPGPTPVATADGQFIMVPL